MYYVDNLINVKRFGQERNIQALEILFVDKSGGGHEDNREGYKMGTGT